MIPQGNLPEYSIIRHPRRDGWTFDTGAPRINWKRRKAHATALDVMIYLRAYMKISPSQIVWRWGK